MLAVHHSPRGSLACPLENSPPAVATSPALLDPVRFVSHPLLSNALKPSLKPSALEHGEIPQMTRA